MQQPRRLRPPLEHPDGRAQQVEVEVDLLEDSGTPDLDHDLTAVLQQRFVDLSDRGRRQRLGLDPREDVGPEVGVDHLLELVERHRRHLVHELAELGDVDVRQEVRPRGEKLAELHERGAEILEREPKVARSFRSGRPLPDDAQLADDSQDPAAAGPAGDLGGAAQATAPPRH